MSAPALLLIIGLLIWLWLVSMQSRDIAIHTARKTCADQDLQLLDGTVLLRSIRPFARSIDNFGLRRTFSFDYSADGIGRQSGAILMHNRQVVSVILEQP